MDAFQNRHSTYFMQTSELAEIGRLLNQDRLVTSVVSLLPTGVEASALHDVLDIGCGPGGWVLDLITEYPHISGVGVDISEEMIKMANHLQRAEKKDHLTFRLMDVTDDFTFPDASFDYVHMRLCQSFLYPSMWPPMLKEAYRVLRSGGVLCITDLEALFTNKELVEEYFSLIQITWAKAHMNFSPSGRSFGVLAGLIPLLRQAGFVDRRLHMHGLDVSKERGNEEYYAIALENVRAIFAGTFDRLVAKGGYTQEYLLDLNKKAEAEMQAEDFACIALLFSMWCTKKE